MGKEKAMGRPIGKEESKTSCSFSILPSKKRKIIKKYGSVTAFVNQMIAKENI